MHPPIPPPTRRAQSRSEEAVNALLHALGLLASVGIGVVALRRAVAGDWAVRFAAGCYAASLVAVFFCSVLSHALECPPAKRRWEALDQGSIFLLIAGSYLPFAAAWLRDGWWPALTAAIVAAALAGFLAKTMFHMRIERSTLWPYLAMGWLPALALPQLAAAMPTGCLALVVAGGLCYTVGAGFLACDHRRMYLHAAWHAFVLAGAGCHAAAILGYALPPGDRHVAFGLPEWTSASMPLLRPTATSTSSARLRKANGAPDA